jgi:hypothetical protein
VTGGDDVVTVTDEHVDDCSVVTMFVFETDWLQSYMVKMWDVGYSLFSLA